MPKTSDKKVGVMSDVTDYYNSRIKNVLLIDRKDSPKRVLSVLKSEILSVISNYLTISDDSVHIDIIVNRDGLYELRLRAISSNIKVVNSFADYE